jgi:hypothetical protein
MSSVRLELPNERGEERREGGRKGAPSPPPYMNRVCIIFIYIGIYNGCTKLCGGEAERRGPGGRGASLRRTVRRRL